MYYVMLLVWLYIPIPQRLIYYIGLFTLRNTLKLLTVREVWHKFSCLKYVPISGGRSWLVHKYQKELVCS